MSVTVADRRRPLNAGPLGSGKMWKSFLNFFMSVTLVSCATAQSQDETAWPDEIRICADVSIDDEGRAELVRVVVPPLTPHLAGPIEDVITEWTFPTATEGGRTVPRTTSVFAILRFVHLPGSEGRIELEKVSEGPRIVNRAYHPCLADVSGATPTLTFVVTEDGHAEEVTASQSPTKEEICAIELVRETTFKPDSINGHAVESRVTREIEIHR